MKDDLLYEGHGGDEAWRVAKKFGGRMTALSPRAAKLAFGIDLPATTWLVHRTPKRPPEWPADAQEGP